MRSAARFMSGLVIASFCAGAGAMITPAPVIAQGTSDSQAPAILSIGCVRYRADMGEARALCDGRAEQAGYHHGVLRPWFASDGEPEVRCMVFEGEEEPPYFTCLGVGRR